MRLLSKIISLSMLMLINGTSYADQLEMSSTDFLDKGILPVLYTCDGQGISPQLSWSASPKGTKSYVLMMSLDNKNNNSTYDWIIYDLPSSLSELPSNALKLPGGAKLGQNSTGKSEFQSPCPERGGVQSYVFTLYALDKKLELPAGKNADAILHAMKGHILQSGHITAVYSRWPKAFD